MKKKNMNKFEQNELVVLKPEFDDSNYKRIYKVIDVVEEDKVVIMIETEVDAKTKEPVENFDTKPLGPYEITLFQSYM
jgi:hypothetical protein